MTPLRSAASPILAVCALMVLAAAAQAEEIDVLTLKSGRVLEGHYNPATKAFFFGGGIVGSVHVEPDDIVKQEKRMRAEGGDPKVADAPAPATAPAPAAAPASVDSAAAPADPTAAPGTAPAGGTVDPATQAKRALAAYNLKHAQLLREIKSSEDYQRLYTTNIAKFEAEQNDLPQKIQNMAPRIDRARLDLESAQSRYTVAQNDYDSWRRNYTEGTLTYHGASVGDAKNQRDRQQRVLSDLLDEEKKATRRVDQVSKDLVNEKAKLQNSIDKQAKLHEDLAALEANPPPAAP